ncbi:MAG: hypothetical protein ABJF04_10605 [Reichenbachiella sp.]|uniref:hypothetical protein n=1 Tax=Reichenbachiella sp. TaxID=2184521 RepID=UPI003263C89C
MKISQRTLSMAVLVAILCYGVLRIWVLQFYADFLSNLLEAFSVDINDFRHLFQSDVNAWKPYQYGWVIYYPTYFLLHVLFIFFLFKKQKKVRNSLIIGLTLLIFILLASILLGRFLDLFWLSNMSWVLFRKLFGLPFILLAIEGGRILYSDLTKRLAEK